MCKVYCTAVYSIVYSIVVNSSNQTGTKQGPNREKFSFKMDRRTDRTQVHLLSCPFEAKKNPFNEILYILFQLYLETC